MAGEEATLDSLVYTALEAVTVKVYAVPMAKPLIFTVPPEAPLRVPVMPPGDEVTS